MEETGWSRNSKKLGSWLRDARLCELKSVHWRIECERVEHQMLETYPNGRVNWSWSVEKKKDVSLQGWQKKQVSRDNFENEDVGWKKNGCTTVRKNPMEMKHPIEDVIIKRCLIRFRRMCTRSRISPVERGNVPVMIVGRDVGCVNVQVDGGMIDLNTRNSG